MDLAALLQTVYPDFDRVEVAPLVSAGQTVGWESIYLDRRDKGLGGAVHPNLEMCRQIGLAETLERFFVLQIRNRGDESLLTESFPTSCGFALGFEAPGTRKRSEAEALERWVWSKWIDSHFYLASHKPTETELNPLSRFFIHEFERVSFYIKELDFAGRRFNVGITVGFCDGGAFAGSRVAPVGEDVWTHALSESWRHLQFFRLPSTAHAKDLVARRLSFFATNGGEAERQIALATKTDWPKATLLISQQVQLESDQIFLFRTLCADYLSWHLGGEKRFVY